MASTPAFWMALASLLFATMSALIKVAAVDYSLAEIVLFRTAPSVVLLLGYARLRGLPIFTQNWPLHAARSLAGATSMALAFYATANLPLATAATLDQTAPIFILVYVLLRGRLAPTAVEVLALLGGFAGILLLLRPTFVTGQSLAFLGGLFGGILAAAAWWQIRRLGRVGEPPWRIVLLSAATGMCGATVALPFAQPSRWSLSGVVVLAGIAACGLLAQLAMTHAFALGSTTRVAAVQYTVVMFAALYGFLFWGDRVSVEAVAGLGMLLTACITAGRRCSVNPASRRS